MTEFPIVPTGDNMTRQVLSDHADLMIVAFRFEASGAVGALHHHPHVQSTYVESGRFRFTLGDEEREVSAGDCFVVPSGMEHGCVCIEPGKMIDSFTPRREDFL